MEWLDRTASEKLAKTYAPKLPKGECVVMVRSFEFGTTLEVGSKISIEYEVVEGDNVKKGDVYGDAFFVETPKWGGTYARRAVKALGKIFCETLGIPLDETTMTDQVVNDSRLSKADVTIREQVTAAIGKAQPAKGMLIRAKTVQAVDKETKKPVFNKYGAEVLNTTYSMIPQTAESIAERRRAMEGGESLLASVGL